MPIAVEPLRHDYTPRGVLVDLINCRADEVIVSGPAGTGKSMACLEKVHLAAMMNPGMRALIVRKTLASLGSTALQTWRKRVIPEAIKAGVVKYYGGSSEEPPQYRYTNGSAVVIGGMDKSIRIMSSEYDMAYVQEATELTPDDWEAITTRLRHGVMSFQQLIADCNPDAPWHWLYLRAQSGAARMLESRHEDNPTLFDDSGKITEFGKAYIAKLDKLTGVRYQRLRRGLWVAAEGLVYDEWDPAVHVIDPFDIPVHWTRWWAIDFGFTNPFVLQCWAQDPDGRLYMYREIYRTQQTVDQHANTIMAEVADPLPGDRWHWKEPKPRAIVCDHDAEGRETFSQRVGLSTTAANKAVIEGIQSVQRRLRPQPPDGRPRLFLMRGACRRQDPLLIEAKRPTCTAEEMVGYVWDRKAGKGIKETPVKEDDHGCDTMRYLVAQIDTVGRPNVRFF
jgi:PBSX family phage terminase large subunit